MIFAIIEFISIISIPFILIRISITLSEIKNTLENTIDKVEWLKVWWGNRHKLLTYKIVAIF